MKMKYAPVIIPTLSRHKHFIRLIESLKRNSWAKYTEVFIGLDYPPSEKYQEGYLKIKEYLRGDFSIFAGFHVIMRNENLGSLRNSKELNDFVLKHFDRFIRTDDDVEFSPNFLEYMDKCLMKYENDPDVVAVSGYSYPVNWQVQNKSTVFKENFICPMWGTGFWRDKFSLMKNTIETGFLHKNASWIIDSHLCTRMLKSSRVEFANLCLTNDYYNSLAYGMTDIAVRMYTVVNSKYVIFPVVSKVRNWGFDGSGVFCAVSESNSRKITARTYSYNLQDIDQSAFFELIEDKQLNVNENRQLLDKFEDISYIRNLITTFKLRLYKVLGRKTYEKYKKLVRHE